MKKLYLLLLLLTANNIFAQTITQPNQKAVINPSKDVRFTVLTSGIVRMEWNENGEFIDDASFVVINRNLPVPQFTSNISNDILTVETDKMVIKYKINSGKFTEENLSVKSAKNIYPFEWKPGDVQKNNLKGTYRTLDGYKGDTHRNGEKMPIEDGLLATDGWTLIDDSNSFLFDGSNDWSWVKTRTDSTAQDWYFMAYGHDYKTAITDFTKIAGKVPVPPLYAFGYWWSRYWSYSDKEIRELVRKFNMYNVPLDVMVIDMDWHLTFDWDNTPKDEFGQRVGWTGWTWNNNLFPNPEKLLGWIKEKNLKVTLNLHPASGIAAYETQYNALAEKLKFDTSTKKNIAWEVSNKTFMKNFFETVLHPMEKQGVDFWWLDWQQWKNDKKIEGLSNTWWLNYTFFTEMQHNRKSRAMLYHRWGGLGNHRYQIGFSGDAAIDWESLKFQPYFTNCASNVLYGYWSHDIGGHMYLSGQEKTLDPELYTRWVQYGVFSPILRTHSTKDASLNKEIWNFKDEYFETQFNAINLRYQLVPYIYSAARQCYETGISICRPMYYDYPDESKAYEYSNEYMFGDDILIAPVTSPSVDGYSTVKVWLPDDNDWFEWNTGTLIKGGQELERKFTIAEYPVYIKSGAIIPMYNDIKNLKTTPENIRFCIFPKKESATRMYEDNGNDNNYATEYAYTNVSTKWINANTFKINIAAREGVYQDMKTTNKYEIMLYGVAIPKSIIFGGKEIDYKYTGENLSLLIDLGEQNCNTTKEITINYNENNIEINDGIVNKFKTLTKATTELKFKNAKIIIPEIIGKAEETSINLEYFPERFNELIENFKRLYTQIPQALDKLNISAEDKDWYLKKIGLK